jgi:hypothetical protein
VSPDGRRILFQSETPGTRTLCDLPDCTNARLLELRSGQWTPDSQGVAYINDQDHRNLWKQPLDGGPPQPLTRFADAQILDFAWSPDGKRLVLSRSGVRRHRDTPRVAIVLPPSSRFHRSFSVAQSRTSLHPLRCRCAYQSSAGPTTHHSSSDPAPRLRDDFAPMPSVASPF